MEVRDGFPQQLNRLLHLFSIVHRERDSEIVVQVKSRDFEDLKWKMIIEDREFIKPILPLDSIAGSEKAVKAF